MVDGETKICGIIGNPVGHSLSPAMHNAAFSELGLNFVYLPFPVQKEKLKEAVEGLKALGIKGGNVTIPHKSEVIKYLDEVEELAQRIGAVNTIVREKGKLRGFNTDALGFKKALEEKRIKLEEREVILFGAGGAAKALAFQLASEGSQVTIVNRTLERAQKVKENIESKLDREVEVLPLSEKEEVREKMKEAEIMTNATSVGMREQKSIVPKDFLHPKLVVMDIIYTPVNTKLIKQAQEVGCKKIINGVQMLVYQGALGFKAWTGEKAPEEVMRKAVLEELA